MSYISTFAEVLSEMMSSYFAECITHFNKPCVRRGKDSARYFYNKKEVNNIIKNLSDPNSVTVTPLCDNGEVWCYVMDYAQVTKEKRNRTTKTVAMN